MQSTNTIMAKATTNTTTTERVRRSPTDAWDAGEAERRAGRPGVAASLVSDLFTKDIDEPFRIAVFRQDRIKAGDPILGMGDHRLGHFFAKTLQEVSHK